MANIIKTKINFKKLKDYDEDAQDIIAAYCDNAVKDSTMIPLAPQWIKFYQAYQLKRGIKEMDDDVHIFQK